MTPNAEAQIRAAIAELGEAIVAALDEPKAQDGPDRLMSIAEAADLLGVGRTALYNAIGAGRVRTVKLGGRRLIPASAIADVAGAGRQLES